MNRLKGALGRCAAALFAAAVLMASMLPSAQAAGVTLGPVLRISEGLSRGSGSVRTFERAARASAMPASIEAGQQALTVGVHVTWVLN